MLAMQVPVDVELGGGAVLILQVILIVMGLASKAFDAWQARQLEKKVETQADKVKEELVATTLEAEKRAAEKEMIAALDRDRIRQRVEEAREEMARQLAENTDLTREAGVAAAQAYDVANHSNVKLAETNERLIEMRQMFDKMMAERQAAQDERMAGLEAAAQQASADAATIAVQRQDDQASNQAQIDRIDDTTQATHEGVQRVEERVVQGEADAKYRPS